MKLKNLKEAIDILLNYVDEDEHIGGSEHDVLYLAMIHPDKMHASDVSRLTVLGFSYEDESGWRGFT